MANELIRPTDLPVRNDPVASEVVPSDNGTTVGGLTLEKLVAAGRPLASKAEAEAGTNPSKAMTPLTTKQAVTARIGVDIASKAQGDKADTALQAIVAGPNTTVDTSDPLRPIVSSSGDPSAGDKLDVEVVAPGQWVIARDFETVADLLSDTERLGYAGSGARVTVSPGQIVTAQGFRYEVAASDAVDFHVETAGGVKLTPTETKVTPFIFGGKGDGVTDDTDAIRRMYAFVAAMNGAMTKRYVASFEGGHWRITDTVEAGDIDVDFDGGRIVYDGPRDRIAAVFGGDTSFTYKRVTNIYVTSSQISWDDEDYTGVRVQNAQRGLLSITLINGFTIGAEYYSVNQGFSYSQIYMSEIINCKYSEVLTADGAGGTNYVNQNLFIGGRRGQTSSTAALGDCIGTWFRSVNGGYQGHNNNVWLSPCYELGIGQPGDERIPFLLDNCGGYNKVKDARYETGRGPFARLSAPTYANLRYNVFETLLYSAGVGTTSNRVVEEGYAYFNSIITSKLLPRSQTYVSPDFRKAINGWNSGGLYAAGALNLIYLTDTDERKNGGGFSMTKDAVQTSSSRGVSMRFNCEGGEALIVAVDCEPGHSGRINIALYDENGDRITDTTPGGPHLMGGLNWVASWGGVWASTVDQASVRVKISPLARQFRVTFSGGTQVGRIRRFSVTRLGENTAPLTPVNVFGDSDAPKATTNPADTPHGFYGQGDVVWRGNPASSLSMGWVCSVGGYIAPAWSGSSNYSKGALIWADTDKIYECVVAGVSGGSGGPTGTGGEITDGTVTWRYIGSKAAFFGLPNIP